MGRADDKGGWGWGKDNLFVLTAMMNYFGLRQWDYGFQVWPSI